MRDYTKDFADFKDKIWLNAASEGPLPKVAALSLNTAIEWKSLPYQLDLQRFAIVPRHLKESLARLVSVKNEDIILGNSASYGLHILANGLSWTKGDEILTMQNDFPTNILPWLALEEQGVKVIQIKPKGLILTPEELQKNITAKTKLFCISHVHTFSGMVLDIEGFSEICQKHHILFVLNLSQSVGTMPVDLSQLAVDCAVSAGYKWLCGPYGTGFAWIKPELRETLKWNNAYWPVVLSAEELQSEEKIVYHEITKAKRFDMFGTANFFNYVPFKTAVDYWMDVKIENVQKYNGTLMDQLIDGLDLKRYRLISPAKGPSRSNLIVLSHQDAKKNDQIYRDLIAQGIYTALWKNNIRVSPHVYNRKEEIKQILRLLNAA
jgi:cysteine desulfurase / selenocysteine lyase